MCSRLRSAESTLTALHRAARDVADGREREVDEDHGGGQEGHDEPAARGSHGVGVAVPDGRCADDPK